MIDKKNNPYAVSFGRIPTSYINRDLIIDEICSAFTSETVDAQCYKLTGVRGSGKTVTMTAIAKKLNETGEWIVVDLSSSENMVRDLLAVLYDRVPYLAQFIDAELNLSAIGIGVKVTTNRPTASTDVALSKVLSFVRKKEKRVLVTVDEISKNAETVHFIRLFQQMVREDQPLYFLAAGLYGKIDELENTEGLTFFYRAPKLRMAPLNITLITKDYQDKLGVTREVAQQMAYTTKGYAFAYQAMGKYMWEEQAAVVNENVLAKVDAALADGVYSIIWRELSEKEKFYASFICQKEKMNVNELLEVTKSKGADWSRPRKSLIEKELIVSNERGVVEFTVPRFKEYLEAGV